MRNATGDSVLKRAVSLLDAFRGAGPELTLDELIARTGLARSTAHRLAGNLVEVGLLERSGRGWRLGVALFELGQLVPRPQRLRDIAVAYMEDLYEATRETVQLAVLDEGEVLYVEIISGHRKAPTPSRRGGRMPAHCTALGKAMLAFSPDGGRDWIDQHGSLEAWTSSTITDPDRFRRELTEIRRLGLAYDREESTPGLVCVAAPLTGAGGAVRGALSVSMPGGRDHLPEFGPAVHGSARALSRQLQQTGS